MPKPPDIARRPWSQLSSHAWTTIEFRAVAMVQLDAFVAEQSWAQSWSVVERFHDNGINARVPYGPTGLVDAPRTAEEGFRQRPGIPKLLLTVQGLVRAVEAAAEFPQGVLTSAAERDRVFGLARSALAAEYRRQT